MLAQERELVGDHRGEHRLDIGVEVTTGVDANPNEIACPTCGTAELTSGLIVGRSPGVKFKQSRGLLGDLVGIPLTKGIFNHSAPAFRCAECGTVVVQPER